MRERVYLETTVVSYLAALPSRDLLVAARQQITHEWWREQAKRFDLFVSELVIREASAGDAGAAERRLALLDDLPSLAMTDAVVELAEHLVDVGAIPQKAAEDALHIGAATVHGMDFVLTWNFRHIANALARRRIGRACLEAGFEPPLICTPEELTEEV